MHSRAQMHHVAVFGGTFVNIEISERLSMIFFHSCQDNRIQLNTRSQQVSCVIVLCQSTRQCAGILGLVAS